MSYAVYDEIIKVTDYAKSKIKEFCENYQKNTVIFSTKTKGCNGLEYVLFPTDDVNNDNTTTIKLDKNIYINVDSESMPYLKGTEIDWNDDFFESGFIFKNPNATSYCGCGNSFKVE